MLKIGDRVVPKSDEAIHKFDVYEQEIVKMHMTEQDVWIAETNHGVVIDAFSDESESVLVLNPQDSKAIIKDAIYKFYDQTHVQVTTIQITWHGDDISSVDIKGKL